MDSVRDLRVQFRKMGKETKIMGKGKKRLLVNPYLSGDETMRSFDCIGEIVYCSQEYYDKVVNKAKSGNQ